MLTPALPPLNRALGSAGNQMVGSSSPTSPKLSVKQEPSVTSAVERTVVSQTLSQTFVHVSKSFQIV